jgi:rare lipoprotein A
MAGFCRNSLKNRYLAQIRPAAIGAHCVANGIGIAVALRHAHVGFAIRGYCIMHLPKIIIAGFLTIVSVPLAGQADIGSDLGTGMASYYGNELAGNRTASGEIFNPSALTAAHRSIAFGTRIRVTNLRNGQDVVVRVNDRGPFIKSRVIDLSYAAAKEIGLNHTGTGRVKLELLR